MSELKANVDHAIRTDSLLHSIMRRCEVCLVVKFIFFLLITYSNSRRKSPDNAMPSKSSGPNGQNDKEAALERENEQLRDQRRLQKYQQAQKKRYSSPPMQQAKRAKTCNYQDYQPPHVSVGDNSISSHGEPSPVCSSNARSSDNHQVILHSNRIVPSRNGLLSPVGCKIITSSHARQSGAEAVMLGPTIIAMNIMK